MHLGLPRPSFDMEGQPLSVIQLTRRDQWSVAYRKINGGNLIKERKAEFTILPDDGRRYFADPFLLRHRGHTALFMEDFPLRDVAWPDLCRDVDDNGAVTPPRPALEEGYHLSYPNVFE